VDHVDLDDRLYAEAMPNIWCGSFIIRDKVGYLPFLKTGSRFLFK